MLYFLLKMLNSIHSKFSIKDLENLTGIKAHTIRIWEKRYSILKPERTNSNIRYYNLESLQHLLNVTFLYNSGEKISKIASNSAKEICEKVKKINSDSEVNDIHYNAFKLATLNFDTAKFEQAYKELEKSISFEKICVNFFIPLLQNIGFEWQSSSILPANERFISSLIKQKIQFNIELIKSENRPIIFQNKTCVLFLPESELHELGLLFINYKLLLEGFNVVFLGQSIPITNLSPLLGKNSEICFITHFTVRPTREKILNYLKDFENLYLKNSKHKLMVLTNEEAVCENVAKSILCFKKIDELIEELK